MTPKRFHTIEGQPFPCTRLDNRAGVITPRGNYVMVEDSPTPDAVVDRLPSDTFDAIRDLAERGEREMNSGDHDGAAERFNAALALLPDPYEKWDAAGWLLLAIGENAVRAKRFEAAEEPLKAAFWSPGSLGNPWAHLRRGQVAFELGNRERAADELARAYMGGGREIFEGQDEKYFAFVTRVLKLHTT